MPDEARDSEERKFSRTSIKMRVSLMLSEDIQVFAVTRDIAEGGVFVLLDAEKMPAEGEKVNVQVQGLPEGAETPWVEMLVVRTDSDGIGLKIVD